MCVCGALDDSLSLSQSLQIILHSLSFPTNKLVKQSKSDQIKINSSSIYLCFNLTSTTHTHTLNSRYHEITFTILYLSICWTRSSIINISDSSPHQSNYKFQVKLNKNSSHQNTVLRTRLYPLTHSHDFFSLLQIM